MTDIRALIRDCVLNNISDSVIEDALTTAVLNYDFKSRVNDLIGECIDDYFCSRFDDAISDIICETVDEAVTDAIEELLA